MSDTNWPTAGITRFAISLSTEKRIARRQTDAQPVDPLRCLASAVFSFAQRVADTLLVGE